MVMKNMTGGRAAVLRKQPARVHGADFAVVSHGGIIAQFLQKISGAWYKPDYVQIITLYYENGTFALQEEK